MGEVPEAEIVEVLEEIWGRSVENSMIRCIDRLQSVNIVAVNTHTREAPWYTLRSTHIPILRNKPA